MDARRWERIAPLYDLACEQPTAIRDAFLADACQGDEELRREVESLLRQVVSQDGPIERITQHASTAWASPASIGPYRILTLIGEGGMGAVYEAEQDRPRRTVAHGSVHRIPSGDRPSPSKTLSGDARLESD
jgi:hypothetical protein